MTQISFLHTVQTITLKVKKENHMTSIYNFQVRDINDEIIELSKYKNKVLLIVNVASKCGFTKQYEDLEELYQKHRAHGLEILAFPCNQFGGQEPGSAAEIREFCQINYAVSFPLFNKISVNGKDTHPLYCFLKRVARGVLWTKPIKWNFTKFLVDKNGIVIDRYAPFTKPAQLEEKIINLITR